MPLVAQPFSDALLGEVQSLDCRKNDADAWGAEANRWIKGDVTSNDSALRDMANPQYNTRVWVYRLDGEIVGFGSIGDARWPFGPNRTDWKPIKIIPHLGLDKKLHGLPDTAPLELKYSGQLLTHLIIKATQAGAEGLGLWVDATNRPAMRLYDHFKFAVIGSKDEQSRRLEKRYRLLGEQNSASSV